MHELLESMPTELLIANDWIEASAHGDIINPATGEAVGSLGQADAAAVDSAVNAAAAALAGWSQMPGSERAKLLWRLADLIERDSETLVNLETLDVGRPLGETAGMHVPAAIDCFRYYAGWADKLEGQTIPTAGYMGQKTLSYTLKEPVGVVGAITPWNAPLMISSWKLGPSLATGCTVVLKPAQEASLSQIYLGKLAVEAGFPPGVLNILPGRGSLAGDALVNHPGVDMITFTGGPETGATIQRNIAGTGKRAALELGGNAAHLICADADLEAAIGGTVMGLVVNQGQTCACGGRVLVHRSIADQFTDMLAGAMSSIQLGDPFDAATQMGPLVSERHLDTVLSFVAAGNREGAELVTGGERQGDRGFFFTPAVFRSPQHDGTIVKEEIFGPVGVVVPFDDLDEGVAMANDTKYGLGGYVWTENVRAAHRIAEQMHCGAVNINGWSAIDSRLPWGGRGKSGIGGDCGKASLDAFTEDKVVTVVL